MHPAGELVSLLLHITVQGHLPQIGFSVLRPNLGHFLLKQGQFLRGDPKIHLDFPFAIRGSPFRLHFLIGRSFSSCLFRLLFQMLPDGRTGLERRLGTIFAGQDGGIGSRHSFHAGKGQTAKRQEIHQPVLIFASSTI